MLVRRLHEGRPPVLCSKFGASPEEVDAEGARERGYEELRDVLR